MLGLGSRAPGTEPKTLKPEETTNQKKQNLTPRGPKNPQKYRKINENTKKWAIFVFFLFLEGGRLWVGDSAFFPCMFRASGISGVSGQCLRTRGIVELGLVDEQHPSHART